MRTLKDILYRCRIVRIAGSTDIPVVEVISDSRSAGNDKVFVAVKGTQTDGHIYIADVINKGVKAIVCESLPEKKIGRAHV